MNIDDIKKDIIDYNLYHVVDAMPYGDYFVTILNENDKIIIHISDYEGSASWAMSKEEFLNIKTTEELEKHINSILYYNYIVYEYEGD